MRRTCFPAVHQRPGPAGGSWRLKRTAPGPRRPRSKERFSITGPLDTPQPRLNPVIRYPAFITHSDLNRSESAPPKIIVHPQNQVKYGEKRTDKVPAGSRQGGQIGGNVGQEQSIARAIETNPQKNRSVFSAGYLRNSVTPVHAMPVRTDRDSLVFKARGDEIGSNDANTAENQKTGFQQARIGRKASRAGGPPSAPYG